MPAEIFSVGVDLGGTWIRLEAVDRHAHPLKSFKAPAPSIPQLPAFLKKRLSTWSSRPVHLTIASRGVWSSAERKHLKHALRSLADQVVVMSDVEAAWHAAFSSKEAGIIVIAGTGSIAYGRDAHGHVQRSGGWGPLLGDEGSAFWIGKTWLKQTYREDAIHHVLKLVRHSDQAVRRIAALTPGILNKARHNHSASRAVILEAQRHLADLVQDIASRLRFKTHIPISWGGSLLNNPYFRKGVLTALRRKDAASAKRFSIVTPGDNPALTVACLFHHGR